MTGPGRPPSPRQARKAAARRLVAAYDLDGVGRWAAEEPHAWAALQPLLFETDALLRWRAVEAVGRVAAIRALGDLEPVREIGRRALWLMNDESGGVLWVGPEVLGAVVAHVPAVRDELLGVIASFLEEEPFRVGTRWALWRVALASPAEVARAAAGALSASLSDPDPAVRGHAALALAAAAGTAATASLAGDPAPLAVFDPRDGTLRAVSVGAAAAGAFRGAAPPGLSGR